MIKFKTIKNNETAEIEEKRSRFIASIYYVETVEEAEEAIKQTKKKYYDAKHNCFAYIINEKENILKRFSDDGEPNGTAGSPILNVLERNNLCNVLIVVTRYFGGILLGTGGLVRAYTEAATKSVEKSEITEQELGYEIELEIQYQEFEKFKYYCNKNNINIKNIEYKENVSCIIEATENEKSIILANNVYEKDLPNIQKYKIMKKKYIRK